MDILTASQIEYLNNSLGAGWDDETDMRTRGGYMIAKIAKRNRRGGGGLAATCEFCDEILDTNDVASAAHVRQCYEDNRPYEYGR